MARDAGDISKVLSYGRSKGVPVTSVPAAPA